MTAPASLRATPLLCQDILSDMMVLDNELHTEIAGDDERRAIRALNLGQRYFDTVAASMAKVLQQQGGFFQTDTNISIAPPKDLLRIDSVWRLTTTAPYTPVCELRDMQAVGSSGPTLPWVGDYTSTPGAIVGFAWEGDVLWWDRPPDQPYPLTIWGCYRSVPFTDRLSPYSRPDECGFPLATFANHLLHLGDGDTDQDMSDLAGTLFRPLLRSLSPMSRNGPRGRAYTQTHYT